MYRLVIEDDEGRATVVPLIRDELSIGRKEGNTIRLTERNVSRRHARVFRENNLFFVEDLGSYNGVRINGERIAGRRPVREGDLIRIGDYQLMLHREAPGEGPTGRDELATSPRLRSPVRANAKTDPLMPTGEESIAAPVTLPEIRLPPAEPIAESDAPRLVVLTPAVGIAEIALTRTELTLGREGEVAIGHRSLAPQHARVMVDGEVTRIVDLGGGVRVNGEPCSAAELKEGDLVELAGLKLRFAAGRGAAVRPPPRPLSARLRPEEAPAEAATTEPAAVSLRTPRPLGHEDAGRRAVAGGRRWLPIAIAGVGGLAAVLAAYFAFRSPPQPTTAGVPPAAPVPTPTPMPAAPPPVVAPAPPLPAPVPMPEPSAAPEPARADPEGLPARLRDPSPGEAVSSASVPDPPPLRRRRLAAEPPPSLPERLPGPAQAEEPAREPRSRTEPRKLTAAPAAAPEPRETAPEPEPEAPLAKPAPPEPPPPPAPVRRAAPEKKVDAPRARELFRKGTKVLLSSPIEAVGIFQKALQLDPNLADAHKNLGIAYGALENNRAAARHYRVYLKMRPNAPDAAEVKKLLEETAQ